MQPIFRQFHPLFDKIESFIFPHPPEDKKINKNEMVVLLLKKTNKHRFGDLFYIGSREGAGLSVLGSVLIVPLSLLSAHGWLAKLKAYFIL